VQPVNEPKPEVESSGVEDRREFLRKAGIFAAITPPVVTFLLSTSMSSKAIAASSGRGRHFPAAAVVAGAAATGTVAAGVSTDQPEQKPGAASQAPPAQPLGRQSTPAAPPPAPSTLSGAGERG
jgi:hypothetical protein